MTPHRRISLLAIGALMAALVVPAGIAAAANAATLDPSGIETGFQIDGDKTGGSPPSTFDWNSFLSVPGDDGSSMSTASPCFTSAISVS